MVLESVANMQNYILMSRAGWTLKTCLFVANCVDVLPGKAFQSHSGVGCEAQSRNTNTGQIMVLCSLPLGLSKEQYRILSC